MAARGFSSNFLRFRFEYASLVWDCLATGCSNKFHWHARALAFLTLPPLLFLPAAILIIGAHPFGNAYSFGAAIILWPFILEVPGRQVRQAVADGTAMSPGSFDFFFFVVFTTIAIAAQVALLFVLDTKHLSHVLLGAVWGIALAGGLDCARTALASVLAGTEGYPLYGHRSLKPS
ncbi:MAG TPA: hypothetical protein VGX72_14140 [Solirubrobacteraceae bacterium]|jgi:hypothetical protein|nr:hypothetical protein [Solirubrobacteraceae bacterium]